MYECSLLCELLRPCRYWNSANASNIVRTVTWLAYLNTWWSNVEKKRGRTTCRKTSYVWGVVYIAWQFFTTVYWTLVTLLLICYDNCFRGLVKWFNWRSFGLELWDTRLIHSLVENYSVNLDNDEFASYPRPFLNSFLLPSWCAVRSYRPHLKERDPIWNNDWSHISLHQTVS